MKNTILPKKPLQTPQAGHSTLWSILSVVGLIIRIIVSLTDRSDDSFGERRD